MPFKSSSQRAWMFANHPKMAKRWANEGAEDIPDEDENSHLPDPEKEGEKFQKTTPIYAVQMDEPFEVQTIEGEMEGKIGDWLAKGHNGDMWVIDDEMFRDTHEPVGEEIDEMSKTCPSCEEGHHERCRDADCDCCGGGIKTETNMVQMHSVKEMFGVKAECDDPPAIKIPKTPTMNEVFIVEAPIQNRPPPGSQPLKPTEYTSMGIKGQALKQGMTALQAAGQEMTPYKTPQGEIEAFPKDAAPGRGPMKADITKGVWAPQTGSAQGTPFSSQTPTTTMK